LAGVSGANFKTKSFIEREWGMRLYYATGTCSLAAQIVAQEAGIELRLQEVDLATRAVSAPGDFMAINPKGFVPALELDDGEILTEVTVIVQYLADLRPQSELIPPAGRLARYRVQEMLAYINTEFHQSYAPMFRPGSPHEVLTERKAYLINHYALIDKQLHGRQYLFGHTFTVADAYLFTATGWAEYENVKLDLSGFTEVQAFQRRVAARPAVRVAMRNEGLAA
jgi:glutathione S-transferase